MTNMTKAAATKLVNELNESGAAFSAIKTTVRTMGYKEIDTLLAELKVKKAARKGSLNSRFGEWMIEPRTPEQFDKWTKDEDLSKANVAYMKAIYDTMMAVHNKYAVKK